jgi:hypothetical protein
MPAKSLQDRLDGCFFRKFELNLAAWRGFFLLFIC